MKSLELKPCYRLLFPKPSTYPSPSRQICICRVIAENFFHNTRNPAYASALIMTILENRIYIRECTVESGLPGNASVPSENSIHNFPLFELDSLLPINADQHQRKKVVRL